MWHRQDYVSVYSSSVVSVSSRCNIASVSDNEEQDHVWTCSRRLIIRNSISNVCGYINPVKVSYTIQSIMDPRSRYNGKMYISVMTGPVAFARLHR